VFAYTTFVPFQTQVERQRGCVYHNWTSFKNTQITLLKYGATLLPTPDFVVWNFSACDYPRIQPFSGFLPNNKMFTVASLPSQEGKVFIVTGGNAGIGFVTCLNLAAKGGKVYLAQKAKPIKQSRKSRIYIPKQWSFLSSWTIAAYRQL
jgi:hypothetical protein